MSVKLFCDLKELGLLKVEGPDAKKLLQGQLTVDVENMSRHTLGAHCNPQGRILSLFFLFHLQNAYYLLLPRSMVAVALSALKKYAVLYKVSLDDVSESFIMLGCIGFDSNEMQFENINTVTIPTNPQRHILIGKPNEIKKLEEKLSTPAEKISWEKWRNLDVTEGLPAVYPETSGKFLPHEINLQLLHAIDFEKGCYTGQEIIARMHYRGKLKKEMRTVQINSTFPPLPGSDIHLDANEGIGSVVVDASQEGHNCYNVLAIVDLRSSR